MGFLWYYNILYIYTVWLMFFHMGWFNHQRSLLWRHGNGGSLTPPWDVLGPHSRNSRSRSSMQNSLESREHRAYQQTHAARPKGKLLRVPVELQGFAAGTTWGRVYSGAWKSQIWDGTTQCVMKAVTTPCNSEYSFGTSMQFERFLTDSINMGPWDPPSTKQEMWAQ